VADTDVRAQQLPAANPPGKTVEKELRCDHLQVVMRTNGLVRDITALRNVTVTQTETGTNNAKPVVITLTSGTLTAFFQRDTNVVDNIVAERNVVITREDGTARGAKVVYTATNNLARLTGDPVMESAQGWLTAEDAIVYDRTTGRTKAIGNPDFKSKPGALVKTNSPSAQEPSAKQAEP
jgi:lipopolysaccharide export system protein LptA